jgi:hypothetical protein
MNLLVQGADAGALAVGQYRKNAGARDVIEGELRGRARVDDVVELGELGEARPLPGGRRRLAHRGLVSNRGL